MDYGWVVWLIDVVVLAVFLSFGVYDFFWFLDLWVLYICCELAVCLFLNLFDLVLHFLWGCRSIAVWFVFLLFGLFVVVWWCGLCFCLVRVSGVVV